MGNVPKDPARGQNPAPSNPKRVWDETRRCWVEAMSVCRNTDGKYREKNGTEPDGQLALRRFTRLSLGFSKKLENLKAAVALHVAHYNFCRIHGTLGMTPAMAAGVVNDFWTLDDLLAAL